VLSGHVIDTPVGQTYLVDQFYPDQVLHGNQVLKLSAPMEGISRWLNEPSILQTPKEEFCFLDTETSGLAGGAGTYAFLIGVGRFKDNQFQLAQFFMRDPGEEPAHLLALEAFLGPSNILVTFNGKAFDVPLLNARYTMQGWLSPLRDLIQIDLLHFARKLWRNHLPSRALGFLEVEILNVHRSADEVPGWMIPQIYFEYLQTGDAHQMKNVFYHNAMDVLSMAALLNRVATLIANPLQAEDIHKNELAAIGRIYEELGDIAQATSLYQHSLNSMQFDDIYWDSLHRLSLLYKKNEDYRQAIELWKIAADHGQIYAHIELAKHCEHRLLDIRQAIQWTENAISLLNSTKDTSLDRITWLGELEHRLERLYRKYNHSTQA
jgi:uncharacterized protein